jgi:membrane protease YdiL (CAAX protease family)
VNRLASFFRSVIPSDLTQLLFLGGLVCLTIAPHLRWTPATPEALEMLSRQYGSDIPSFTTRVLPVWRATVTLVILPVLFIAFAGYWLGFWPGSQPARRMLRWVMLPASISLCAICGFWLYLTMAPASVLDAHRVLRRSPKELLTSLWTIGPGLHFFLLGMLLLAVFATRLIAKKTSLPLTLCEGSASCAESESWRRIQTLIWAMLGPQALAISAVSMTAYFVLRRFPDSVFAFGIVKIGSIIELVVLIGIAAVIVGDQPTKALWRSWKPAGPNFAVLGVLFPVLLAAAMMIFSYASNRVEWAAREFGQFAPPTFLPENLRFDPWCLLLFLAAFGEEFAFRGLLQPRFIERYGLYRGLFLVGVIWGAFHFPTDRYSGFSDVEIFGWLLSRVASCVAMGFVLSCTPVRSCQRLWRTAFPIL